jgi:1,4-dihydroxy-6-naphthoate synthase
MLLSKEEVAENKIAQLKIAVPGKLTTAFLLLKIFCPQVEIITLPFDAIIGAVMNGTVQAGLVIDSGQMTYEQMGLHKILDLGAWWYEQTNLPTPLGGNIIRKDLPRAVIFQLTELFRESIQYALDHRQEAVKYAMRYAQGMSHEQAMHFIGRYVNELTINYGDVGKQALSELFRRGHSAGVMPTLLKPEFS